MSARGGTDPSLVALLDRYRQSPDGRERERHFEAIRAHYAALVPDPDREAVERAAGMDPVSAERLLGAHFGALAAPVMRPSGAWLDEPEPPPVLWRDDPHGRYADAVLSVGEVCVLTGAGSAGKSWIALAVAVAAERARRDGSSFGAACGLRVRPGPVVVRSYEQDPRRLARYVQTLGGARADVVLGEERSLLYAVDPRTRRWARCPGWHRVWQEIHRPRPSLVVIDTGPKAMGGETMDGVGVIAFLQALEEEALGGGFGVLVLCHDTKATRDSALAGAELGAGAVAGSGQWHDTPRGVLHLTRTGLGGAPRLLEAFKCSHGRDGWGALLSVAYRGTGKAQAGRFAGLDLATALDEGGVRSARAAMAPKLPKVKLGRSKKKKGSGKAKGNGNAAGRANGFPLPAEDAGHV